jgi:hypothetical protein
MKSTILNLIAVTALLIGWTAQAADEMEGKATAAETSAMPTAAAPVTAPLATTQEAQPSPKPAKRHKPPKANQVRSKSLDLRYCLEMESNAEIAKCAGE